MRGWVALFWKNDSIIYLGNYTTISSIAVSGNNVYFSGSRYGTGALYWKNGSAVSMSNNSIYNYATSIAVSGTDVYVARVGGKTNFSIATYWKNGKQVNLTNGPKNAYASSIAISGTNVYVAGSEDSVAKYWKNSTAVTLGKFPPVQTPSQFQALMFTSQER